MRGVDRYFRREQNDLRRLARQALQRHQDRSEASLLALKATFFSWAVCSNWSRVCSRLVTLVSVSCVLGGLDHRGLQVGDFLIELFCAGPQRVGLLLALLDLLLNLVQILGRLCGRLRASRPGDREDRRRRQR